MARDLVEPSSVDRSTRAVIVLGMHRSGTSACTRALAALGLHVGDEDALLPGDANNPYGYFEPAALVDLNQRILALWGASWCNPRLGARPPVLPDALQAAMLDYVQLWTKSGQPWAWKDPRLCITYRYWRPVLPPHVLVIVERAPSEIAASLTTRDGIAPLAGIALWEVYARAILAEVTSNAHIVIRYQGLIGSPVTELAQLAAFLSQHLQLTSLNVDEAARTIDPALQHGAEASPRVFRMTQEQLRLHRQLLEADADGGRCNEERLALLDACLEEIEVALTAAAAWAADQARMTAAAQQVAQQISQLRGQYDALEARKWVRLMHRVDEAKERYARARGQRAVRSQAGQTGA